MPRDGRLRVVVLGYLVRGPLGGLAWHHLHYALGFAALGHEVYFVEDSDDYPSCYDPARGVTDADPGYGLRFAARTFERLDWGERWGYHDAHTGIWHGPLGDRLAERVAQADLLVNVSGMNPLRSWAEHVPVRVLVDTDPVFTQVRHLRDPAARARAEQHTDFFSFASSLGAPDCEIPDDGLPWQPTRQPVCLDAWTPSVASAGSAFTTVMQWESYPGVEHEGRWYGMKAESFGPYLDLPRRTRVPLELAVGRAPRERLREGGWRLRDALEVTRDPWTYQRYLRESRAELGVGKHGYVVSRSGWFSERSACYLASGRPVVVQDTGFGDWLPTGRGVFAFGCPDEAIAGIEAICTDPEAQSSAAREIAAAYFDARTVLSHMIDSAFAGPGTAVRGAAS